jgi:hypothetical protein
MSNSQSLLDLAGKNQIKCQWKFFFFRFFNVWSFSVGTRDALRLEVDVDGCHRLQILSRAAAAAACQQQKNLKKFAHQKPVANYFLCFRNYA